MLELSNIDTKGKSMNLKVTDEFINICQEIISMNLAIEKWRSIESSDMFQSPNFCGGFDAVEASWFTFKRRS
jgi:hypothetical protein